MPLLELVPKLGKRKPLLRSSPTGKEIHGRYRIGIPSKSTVAPRPVPTCCTVSSEIELARSSQDSSDFGQVVNVTPASLRTPSGLQSIDCALPRALRWRISNSACETSAPCVGEYEPLDPRRRTSGSSYSTAPCTFTLLLAES